MTTENDIKTNPLKQELTVEKETEQQKPLRNFLIQHTGRRVNPEDDQVTLEMIIAVLADEFPEVVMALAEENFMRGYQQALQDVETIKQQPEPTEDSIETDVIDAELVETEKNE